MNTKEFRASISQTAQQVRQKLGLRHQDVQINYKLPTVAVGKHGFFAQGEDAAELLEEASQTAAATGLRVSTCLLWWLNGAGAI